MAEAKTMMLASLQGAAGNGPRILTLVRKAEQSLGSRRELCNIYSAAIEAYQCPKAVEDEAYRELCVKYMLELCHVDVNEAREFHNRQRAFGVNSDARMYHARATLEEREGDETKAMKILQEGLRCGARPAELLKKQIARLLSRDSLKQVASEVRTQADCAVQTDEVAPSRPSSSWPTDRPTLAERVLRSLERMNRTCCLFDVFGAWKDLRDAAVQLRREALFDALRTQLDMAQRRTRAAEVATSTGARGPLRAWVLLILRTWRSAAELWRQRQRLAEVAFQEELRRRAFRVLLAWRNFHEKTPREPVQPVAAPMLESLLVDLQPKEKLLSRTRQRSPLRTAEQRNANGAVLTAQRSPRAEGDEEDEPKRPTLLRGPERFFYDTSSYTGCARYGGPMIVDKKENLRETNPAERGAVRSPRRRHSKVER
ncbi:unnamed protein product [Durusdinium trenchii]|uniref:Uncharacterized protein n=2 Tax=Durusdinium trenchii TaxID=1381693 RepID=A0ABP0KF68_9DINO